MSGCVYSAVPYSDVYASWSCRIRAAPKSEILYTFLSFTRDTSIFPGFKSRWIMLNFLKRFKPAKRCAVNTISSSNGKPFLFLLRSLSKLSAQSSVIRYFCSKSMNLTMFLCVCANFKVNASRFMWISGVPWNCLIATSVFFFFAFPWNVLIFKSFSLFLHWFQNNNSEKYYAHFINCAKCTFANNVLCFPFETLRTRHFYDYTKKNRWEELIAYYLNYNLSK